MIWLATLPVVASVNIQVLYVFAYDAGISHYQDTQTFYAAYTRVSSLKWTDADSDETETHILALVFESHLQPPKTSEKVNNVTF